MSCCKSPAGYLLTTELVADMIQTCYRMSSQVRLSGKKKKKQSNILNYKTFQQ